MSSLRSELRGRMRVDWSPDPRDDGLLLRPDVVPPETDGANPGHSQLRALRQGLAFQEGTRAPGSRMISSTGCSAIDTSPVWYWLETHGNIRCRDMRCQALG